MDWWWLDGPDLLLRLRVQPRASHPGIIGIDSGRLKVRVSAPPVEGAANRAILETIADALDLPRSRLRIERGESARNKDLRVLGGSLEAETLLACLAKSR